MCTNPSPITREFISVEGADIHSRSQPDGFRFRLVSYNILAQAYVKSSLFPHSPSPSLKWKARSKSILTILKNLGADFLCLQELDEYDSFYKEKLENDGYSSIYVQRGGQKRDGCGIFYKSDRAELIFEEKIDYNDLVNFIEDEKVSCDDQCGSLLVEGNKDAETKSGSPQKNIQDSRGDSNDPRVRLKRDCVGTMAAFRLMDPSHNVVIVANTHIYWDPEWADVKLEQVKYILLRLSQFKKLVSDKFECAPPIIVAGDFNSTPGDKIYRYLISGASSSVPSECFEEIPIPLCSVYAFTGGEPPFTNFTPGFTGTLDYIFFSPCSIIKPVSFLKLPESNSYDVGGGLPNYYHPSDHLPIGCDFEITET